MTSWLQRQNFEAVCSNCVFCLKGKSGPLECTKPVDIVTGAGKVVSCVGARGKDGFCGPQGQHFQPATVTVAPAANDKTKKGSKAPASPMPIAAE